LFRRMLTLLPPGPPVARSGLPSRLKSPTAREDVEAPEAALCGFLKVPSPLPRRMFTVLPELPVARSSRPSPLKSAVRTDAGTVPAG